MKYVPRQYEALLKRLRATFPVTLVVGPRQCGKTTVVHAQVRGCARVDLERVADYQRMTADLELFLQEHTRGLVIDEAQRCPALFPALRHAVDQRRAPGQYVLLGSAGPPLLNMAAESLAGRMGVLELTPFTVRETIARWTWPTRWWRGGLPPLYALRSERARSLWLENYVTAFLERDLPVLGVRVPAARIRQCWTMLVHLHGQLLTMSDVARAMNLSVTAVQHYLDILEGAHMIRRLQPFYANVGKRLTKRPKLYLRDSGILHHLAGLRTPAELDTWPGRGRSFEGLVIEELINCTRLRHSAPQFYFWRTQAGAEVDLLIALGQRLVPVEIKHGIAVGRHDSAGLRHCMQDLGIAQGYIVTRGEHRVALGNGMTVLPWRDIMHGRVPW
jgi:predicted AAA+ superfamily ATPase